MVLHYIFWIFYLQLICWLVGMDHQHSTCNYVGVEVLPENPSKISKQRSSLSTKKPLTVVAQHLQPFQPADFLASKIWPQKETIICKRMLKNLEIIGWSTYIPLWYINDVIYIYIHVYISGKSKDSHSHCFSRKDNCYTKHFQLTNAGDTYFYSLGPPGYMWDYIDLDTYQKQLVDRIPLYINEPGKLHIYVR